MSEFVEESDGVVILHQPGIGRSRLGQIADEYCFRHLFATDSVKNLSHFRMSVFARSRMHIQIKSANHLSTVDYVPGFNGRVPRRHVMLLPEADVEEGRRRIEHALLYLVVRQIWPYRLRIERITCPTQLLLVIAVLVIVNFRRLRIGLLL